MRHGIGGWQVLYNFNIRFICKITLEFHKR